jgi:hypothetical protein
MTARRVNKLKQSYSLSAGAPLSSRAPSHHSARDRLSARDSRPLARTRLSARLSARTRLSARLSARRCSSLGSWLGWRRVNK